MGNEDFISLIHGAVHGECCVRPGKASGSQDMAIGVKPIRSPLRPRAETRLQRVVVHRRVQVVGHWQLPHRAWRSWESATAFWRA